MTVSIAMGNHPMNILKLATVAGLACTAVAANAATVSLDFEGIAAYPNSNNNPFGLANKYLLM